MLANGTSLGEMVMALSRATAHDVYRVDGLPIDKRQGGEGMRADYVHELPGLIEAMQRLTLVAETALCYLTKAEVT